MVLSDSEGGGETEGVTSDSEESGESEEEEEEEHPPKMKLTSRVPRTIAAVDSDSGIYLCMNIP